MNSEERKWMSLSYQESSPLSLLPLSPPYIPIAKKYKYENDTLFFFTPNTLFLKESQNKVFQSTYCIKTYPTVKNILLHFCISFLFCANLLCKCIHGWRPSAILWANCIHLYSQMRRQVCLNFFYKLKWTRPSKQCKSLIWVLIFVSYRSNLF